MAHRSTLAVLLIGAALASLPAAAQQVGTTTAVNPSAQGAAPSANSVALTVGQRIVHKERIQTSPSGTVQLLFMDKSTLSIAPNTNILIDEFVYDPSSGSGHSAITLAQGAFRLVGGAVSHQGEATVTTSAAVIGIRGGTLTVKHDQRHGTRIINHYGAITIQNGCGQTVIKRAGFAVSIPDWNTCALDLARVSEAETAHDLAMMTSKKGESGGVGLSGARITQIFGGGGTNPAVGTGNGESNALQIIIQATEHASGSVTPPPFHRRPPPDN